ncbi:MAG: hypothetical protein P8173_15875 [Gammaproteobacteria bacterium]
MGATVEIKFHIDICCASGGAVRIIACIEDWAVTGKIVSHLMEKAMSVAPIQLPEGRPLPDSSVS